MFSKLTEAQKQFFETGRTRDLAFRICQLQLLADAMRKNETVLEEALKILENLHLNLMPQRLDLYLLIFDIRFKIFRNGRLQNV